MRRAAICLAVAFFSAVPARSEAELFFSAEVMPTIGLPGFDTYRITATSDWGNIVGLDFTEVGNYGILGPLNQVNPIGMATIYSDMNNLFGGIDPSQDTQFLFHSSSVVSAFNSESDSSLQGIFGFAGDDQLAAPRNLPFVQISTPQASAVTLRGGAATMRSNGMIVDEFFDIRLSEIAIGPPPNMPIVPVPRPVQPPAIPPVQPPAIPPVQLPPQTSPDDIAGGHPGEDTLEPPVFNDPPINIDPVQWDGELMGGGIPEYTLDFDPTVYPIVNPWIGASIDVWTFTSDPNTGLFAPPIYFGSAIDYTMLADIDVSGYAVVHGVVDAGIYMSEDRDTNWLVAGHRTNTVNFANYFAAINGTSSSTRSAASAAPEPSSIFLLTIGGLAIGRLARRHAAGVR